MSEKKSELYKILSVLGVAVAVAFAVTAYFILIYGPSGRYTAQAVLLEPSVLNELNYNDYNPRTGGDDRYVFDEIKYASESLKEKKMIDLKSYGEFYQIVQKDKSLLNPVDLAIEDLFKGSLPASLELYVHTESSAAWQKDTKLFQEIQFAKQGDYYRIELHEQNRGTHWVYFHHPQILSITSQLWSK